MLHVASSLAAAVSAVSASAILATKLSSTMAILATMPESVKAQNVYVWRALSDECESSSFHARLSSFSNRAEKEHSSLDMEELEDMVDALRGFVLFAIRPRPIRLSQYRHFDYDEVEIKSSMARYCWRWLVLSIQWESTDDGKFPVPVACFNSPACLDGYRHLINLTTFSHLSGMLRRALWKAILKDHFGGPFWRFSLEVHSGGPLRRLTLGWSRERGRERERERERLID
jgi:hypothetical protein